MSQVRIEIGGIGLLFRYKDCRTKEGKNSELNIRDFIKPGRNDFIIDVKVDKLPGYYKEKILFEANENWRSYIYNGNFIFETYESQEGEPEAADANSQMPVRIKAKDIPAKTTRICVMKKDLPRAKLYISPEADTSYNGKGWSLEQLMKIMGQLIVISILHRHQGLLTHSSGIILNGEGIIFPGVSGAGKTTLTKLCQKRGRVAVLSDDRVILRREGGRYFIYGTPWPGDGKAVSSMRAPLREIMFLAKAGRNRAVPLDRREAFRQIITQCFPALWDKDSIGFSLKFCGDLVKKVLCFSFGFVPDESAANFIADRLSLREVGC